ncbi:MAG: hypothetical protein V1801_00650 [Candidatus Falkowbacteria bacterium]
MGNEMPKFPDDLIKDRENLQQKVAAIQAQKNRDIGARVLDIEKNRDETKKLGELLEEANKNLEYYEELNKTEQLPEDEMENFEKAKQIVEQIKTKIAEHDEAAEKAMAISDVKDKVMEEAGGTNKWLNEKKEKEQKEKIIEEKVYQWFEKLVDLAEELNKKQEVEIAKREKAEGDLTKKIDEARIEDNLKQKLKHALETFYVGIDRFKEIAAAYKNKLSGWRIFKKQTIDSIINSNELRLMEQAEKNFNKFFEENNLKGYAGRGLKGCVNAILNTNNYGMTQELKDLSILSFSEPWVNFDRMVEKAYNRNKQRFEEFGLKLDDITYRINKME